MLSAENFVKLYVESHNHLSFKEAHFEFPVALCLHSFHYSQHVEAIRLLLAIPYLFCSRLT